MNINKNNNSTKNNIKLRDFESSFWFCGYIYNLKIFPYPPVVFRLWIMHRLFR